MTNGRSRASDMILALGTWLALTGTDPAVAASAADPPKRGFGATTPNPSAPNPVAPIVKQMQAAESRLKQGDTGPETRTIQQQVVHDLEKLIDAARQSGANQNARKPSSPGKSDGESENGSQPQKQQQGQQQQAGGSDAASQSNGGAAPGSRGGTRKSIPVPKNAMVIGTRSLEREVWGHLPPAVRARVPVDFSETVLPAYDELVRRYFEALLEDVPQRRGGAPARKVTPPLDK